MQEFFINKRFLVNPELNRVHDMAGKVDTRLEPRIMQLLTILCENNGKLVPREKLISEIWNDYGGADEGLTQGISLLRKILGDASKQIIKTVPKRGYILHGSITQDNHSDDHANRTYIPAKSRNRAYRFLIAGAIVGAGTISLTGLYFLNDRVPEPQVTEITFPGNHAEEDNSPLTTVTTTDSLGNRYRLVMIGDQRPKFYVNDSLQLNQEPYDALIDKLAKALWKRQKEAENL
jgi:DNA-binding winged helix-turn-helix (wHTH) protein